MPTQSIRRFFNLYMWYAIIFGLSLVSLIILPMIGAEVGLAIDIPTTPAGWLVWGMSNLTSATLNVLLFHSFIKQGKLNIKDDPAYIAANEILKQNDLAIVEQPRSPKAYHRSLYRSKGTTLFVFTVLGTISLSNAILTFSPVKFIAQFLTVLMGLVCGIFQMKAVEEYWTIEYPEYANDLVKEKDQEADEMAEAVELCEEMKRKEDSHVCT